MAYKIKNETRRKIGVTTAGGIFTVASGKSREFDDIINLDLLKNHEGVTVSGSKTEKPEEETTQSVTVDVTGTDPKVDVKKTAETGAKAATAPSAPKAG